MSPHSGGMGFAGVNCSSGPVGPIATTVGNSAAVDDIIHRRFRHYLGQEEEEEEKGGYRSSRK